MASIRTRHTNSGLTRYRAEVRLAGFTPRSKTFAKQAEAKSWATQTESALLSHRDLDTGQSARTVTDVIERYLKEVLPLKPKAKNQEQQLAWFIDAIGHVTLKDLSIAHIKRCQTQLKEEHTEHTSTGHRSNATVNRYTAALSHALTVAADEWQWLSESPSVHLRRLSESRGRVRFLSTDQVVDDELIEGELSQLLSACQLSTQAALYPMVVLAISTGMRISEIKALTWNDIDIDQQRITIRTSKNGEPRCVPLVGRAYSLLRTQLNAQDVTHGVRVFAHPQDPTQPVDITYAWRKALKGAGIVDFKFHDLRHTAASYLAMSGATHSEIAHVLGHRSLAMVHRYAHLTPDHTSDVVTRMNQHWLN